nr:hypothetical protein Itr_chr12CG29670 [Ipomoea trifida]
MTFLVLLEPFEPRPGLVILDSKEDELDSIAVFAVVRDGVDFILVFLWSFFEADSGLNRLELLEREVEFEDVFFLAKVLLLKVASVEGTISSRTGSITFAEEATEGSGSLGLLECSNVIFEDSQPPGGERGTAPISVGVLVNSASRAIASLERGGERAECCAPGTCSNPGILSEEFGVLPSGTRDICTSFPLFLSRGCPGSPASTAVGPPFILLIAPASRTAENPDGLDNRFFMAAISDA